MGNTANAIGTQKQFSTQPQDTYGQRLTQVTSNISVSTPVGDTATQLARSLGVLGKSVVDFGEDREKRWKETAGIAAKRMIEGKTVKDIQDLKSLEMVQNYTDYDLTDNPYAVSALEKLRGKTMSAQAKSDYDVYKTQNGYNGILTPEAEAARYDKFMADGFGKVLDKTSDKNAFKEGFYDNHVVNQMEQIDSFNKHRSIEYKALRKADTNLETAQLVRDAINMEPKDIIDRGGLIFRHTRLTGADTLERKEYAKEFATSLAKHGINPETINEVVKGIVVGTDTDGKDITLERAVSDDLVSILDHASIRQTQLQDEEFQKVEKALYGAGSLDKANQIFAELKVKRPQMWLTMSTIKNQVVDFYQKAEKKAQVATLRAGEDKLYNEEASLAWKANFTAHYNGGANIDAKGNPVGGALSTLKPVKYRHVNDDMTTTTKEKNITPEQVIAEARNQSLAIAQDAQGDENKYYYNMMKLYTHKPSQVYTDTIKSVHSRAFANLNVESLSIGEGGQAEYPRHVKDALKLYQADSAGYYQAFGKELTTDVEVLVALTASAGDNLSDGVKLYASSRTKLEDSKVRTMHEKSVQNKLDSTGSMKGILDMDGNVVSITRGASSNAAVEARMSRAMVAHMATGMSAEKALATEVENLNKTHWYYRDTLLPKASFQSIPVPPEEKAKIGKTVMDNYVGFIVGRNAGTSEKDVTMVYDEKTNTIEIHVGNDYIPLNANSIQWAATQMIDGAKRKSTETGKNYTWQDYQNDSSIPAIDLLSYNGTD